MSRPSAPTSPTSITNGSRRCWSERCSRPFGGPSIIWFASFADSPQPTYGLPPYPLPHPWSGLALGCVLARVLHGRIFPYSPVIPACEGAVDGTLGGRVYHRRWHYSTARPTHTYTIWLFGHRWVILAVVERLPLARTHYPSWRICTARMGGC